MGVDLSLHGRADARLEAAPGRLALGRTYQTIRSRPQPFS